MSFNKLCITLLFVFTCSFSFAQNTAKEVTANKLNEIIQDLTDRKTPSAEIGRLIDYASSLFSPKAKIEIDYIGNRGDDREYSPRKYFYRLSKMGDNAIVIKAKDIYGFDTKGRIIGLTITETY
ncbi:hypothetical protein [Flammeovirga sp. SubArs3]|uniref:hypothetical protein n=1 Tax=Flammeovirga sp. SubArs3 TaxID=2995316 RepID=UPI00248AC3F4|nr:hypothetical protein [Flammeovirga sp. SubArs3]